MSLEARPNQITRIKSATAKKAAIHLAMTLLMAASVARAQSPQIVTLRLGPDQIGVVKTAERFSTRLTFREPIKEIICGDLYDPESGIGAFVIQRIDNNIFIKPVASKGVSNMFVKTGDRAERIYNFSLLIVPIDQVHFIINVTNPADSIAAEKQMSKQPASSPMRPPIVTNISANDSGPGNTIGSVAGVLSFRLSKTGEPEEPPPAPAKMKSNSPVPAIVATSDRMSREVIRRVKPVYPEKARMAGVSGEVIAEITINDSGKVTAARAISGPIWLRDAAVSAARSWKFSPLTPGQANRLDVSRITFNFQLAKF